MNKHLIWLTVLFLLLPLAVRAETLDDDTIRKVYAEIKDAIHDPIKSREVLQARLDDNYTLKSDVIRHIGDQPPQKFSASLDKKQAIQDTVDNIARMKMDKYDSQITGIRYSGDHQYAYVEDATVSSGGISVPTTAGSGKMEDFGYNGKETCSHILALGGDRIKVMQAQCDDDITLQKQK